MDEEPRDVIDSEIFRLLRDQFEGSNSYLRRLAENCTDHIAKSFYAKGYNVLKDKGRP